MQRGESANRLGNSPRCSFVDGAIGQGNHLAELLPADVALTCQDLSYWEETVRAVE